MEIQTVHNAGALLQVTLMDGTILWVPVDIENADYLRVQGWVAAGGIVT